LEQANIYKIGERRDTIQRKLRKKINQGNGKLKECSVQKSPSKERLSIQMLLEVPKRIENESLNMRQEEGEWDKSLMGQG
jgi:predicted transcriptional regulator